MLVDEQLGPLLDEHGGAGGRVHSWLGDTDALAVFLCHERRKGEGSRWAPWLSLLPPLDTDSESGATSSSSLRRSSESLPS